MKRFAPIAIAFLLGAALASVCWGLYSWYQRVQLYVTATEDNHGKARAGELVLDYLDQPEPGKAARLAFIATNFISGFLNDVDMCERTYPYLHLKHSYLASDYSRYRVFLEERSRKSAGSERDGPANRSQPVRSETNRTSAAAGSGR